MDDWGFVWSGIGAPAAWLSHSQEWADALAKGGKGVARRVSKEARKVMQAAGLQQVWLTGAPFVAHASVTCALALAPQRWLLGLDSNSSTVVAGWAS